MKKILTLSEDYGALRCYRMEQAGRLELLRVLNDPPPYWFVMIRNFNRSDNGPDRTALKGLTTALGEWCLAVPRRRASLCQVSAVEQPSYLPHGACESHGDTSTKPGASQSSTV